MANDAKGNMSKQCAEGVALDLGSTIKGNRIPSEQRPQAATLFDTDLYHYVVHPYPLEQYIHNTGPSWHGGAWVTD